MLTLERLPNWPYLLDRYVSAHVSKPHVWGSNDCVMFAAGAVQAMTAVDPIPELRGRYNDEDSALELLVECGGIAAYCEQLFGSPVPPGLAHRGDILVGKGPGTGMDLCAVCVGPVAVAPGQAYDLDQDTKARYRAAVREARRTGAAVQLERGNSVVVPRLLPWPLSKFTAAYRVGCV
jgi:hypothetical protein